MLKERALNSTNNGQNDDLLKEELKVYLLNKTATQDERTELVDDEDDEDDQERKELGDEEDFDIDEELEEMDD